MYHIATHKIMVTLTQQSIWPLQGNGMAKNWDHRLSPFRYSRDLNFRPVQFSNIPKLVEWFSIWASGILV